MSEDLVCRSVTVAEVIDPDGQRWVTLDNDGDPSPWDLLGLLHYAIELVKRDIELHDSSNDED